MRLKPHPLFVVLRTGTRLGWMVAAGVVAAWLLPALDAFFGPPGGVGPLGLTRGRVASWAALAVAGQLAWNALEWAFRAYELDGDRVRRVGGVLHRFSDELRLDDVRTVAVDQPILQRLLGLGTISFAGAGTSGHELAWVIVGGVRSREAAVRAAIDAARPGAAPVAAPVRTGPS